MLEESGLISKLETWLINQVCKDLEYLYSIKLSASVPMNRGRLVPISINISPISFKNEDVYEKVVSIVSRYKNADRAQSAHFNSEEQTKAPKNSETRHAVESTQAKTVSSASSSKPKNGNKGKLVESDNLMPLDEIMKEKGYCEECGN